MARKRGSTPQRSTARKRRGRTVQPPEPQARRSGTQPSPGPAGPPVEPRFPVVGLGTSAGGLHVLQRFFSAIPETPGIAFVVVQHLDPTHKSETAELLRRHCKIPVAEVHDGEPVVPDRVYVIPPD